jgi:uncharacterized membrane protein
MVPANLAATSYSEPHAGWFRVLSSLAAPTFILVAGMMVAFGAISKHHRWHYFALRGALLLLTGAVVDLLIWKLTPFRSFDVLYLIGFACPLTYLFCQLHRRWQWTGVLIMVLGAPALQLAFGYAECPSDIFLWGPHKGELMAKAAHPTGVAHHLFIDGWFPLFPWMGVSFVGALIVQYFYSASGNHRLGRQVISALVLVLLGVPLWLAAPGPHYVRAGYSELFYPPVVGLVMTALGFAISALWAARWNSGRPIVAPLRWLGEAALCMYVLHFAIIAYVIEPRFPAMELTPFLVLSFVTLTGLVLVAAGLHWLKRYWPKRPYLVKFFFGG